MKRRGNSDRVAPVEEARSLAHTYYDLAGSLGKYRFDNWEQLSSRERSDIESLEWTLLTFSSDMTNRAVILAMDEAGPSLREISAATRRLKQSIARMNDVRSVIRAATKAVTLAAAIFSGNPQAIATSLAAITD